MAEDTSPRVKLIWSGKTYDYKLSIRELEELEDAFDKPMGEIDLTRVKAVMHLIVFGARRAGDEVSLEDLRDMDPDAFESAFEWPEDEAEEEGGDPTSAAEVEAEEPEAESAGGSNGSAPKSSGRRSSKRAATSGS